MSILHHWIAGNSPMIDFFCSMIFPSTVFFEADFTASHVWLLGGGQFLIPYFFASLKLSWDVTKAGLRLWWRERCIPRAAGRNDWHFEVLWMIWMSRLCDGKLGQVQISKRNRGPGVFFVIFGLSHRFFRSGNPIFEKKPYVLVGGLEHFLFSYILKIIIQLTII